MNFNQSDVIPGFRVMEWLRKVREEEYKLREENPTQYAAELAEVRNEMREKRRAQQRKR